MIPPESSPIEFVTGTETWLVDAEFLTSTWTCIWGRGCLGIGDVEDQTHSFGCCSLGAEFADETDAANTAAHAACLDPDHFQFHAEALAGGIFASVENTATRVVDGACIFLNRLGFEGGAGCALHIGAAQFDESPITWKPAVCWELPIRVEEQVVEGQPVTLLRRWHREDFEEDAESLAWFCTDTPEAFVGDTPVIESLREELSELLGDEAVAQLHRLLLGEPDGSTPESS